MNNGFYDEGHYARLELFETNRNHMIAVNFWVAATLALVVIYYVTGKAPVLAMVPWCAVIAVGLLLRGEAMIRRNWALYVEKTGVKGVTPDSSSRASVAGGNIYGLIGLGVFISLAHGNGFRILGELDLSLMYVGDLAFVLSMINYFAASRHVPKFS